MGSRRSRVRTEGRLRAGAALSQTDTRSPRRLLDRILNEPRLAQVVPRLQPEVLHRVIQHYGLEECGELVTLATPQQLARVLDLDLWRTERPGLDEQVDADRFGVWLEVMAESGVAIAAATLAAIDPDLVTAGLAQHVLVFDYAVVAPLTSLDGEALPRMSAFDECLRCEIAGYVMVARRTESWDAIAAVLSALDESHHGYFTQVMSGCRRLSYSRPEVDGLDDLLTAGDQVMFDIAFDRERRRDTQGYVAPAEARAFLQLAR